MSSGAQDDMVRALEEMGGWPREACRAALQLVGNNLEGAAELLLGGFAIPPGGEPLPPGLSLPGEDGEDEEDEEDDEDGPNAADLMMVRTPLRATPVQRCLLGCSARLCRQPPEHVPLTTFCCV